MSEAWRNGYDAWKLSGPPEDEDERTDEEREQDEAARESAMEQRNAPDCTCDNEPYHLPGCERLK